MISLSYELNGGLIAQVRFTSRAEGNFADSPGLAQRQKMVADLPWTHLRQLHGRRVMEVGKAGRQDRMGADAAVTRVPGAVLSVRTADCAAVALVSKEGVLGVVHAGWKGAAGGIATTAMESIHRLGAQDVEAFLSPCIHPECYEFDPFILQEIAVMFGSSVRSETSWGTPALSLPELLKSAFYKAGAVDVKDSGYCTACDADSWFSHRARQDTQRHAMAVWMQEKESS